MCIFSPSEASFKCDDKSFNSYMKIRFTVFEDSMCDSATVCVCHVHSASNISLHNETGISCFSRRKQSQHCVTRYFLKVIFAFQPSIT
jgi:hypothetical protein